MLVLLWREQLADGQLQAVRLRQFRPLDFPAATGGSNPIAHFGIGTASSGHRKASFTSVRLAQTLLFLTALRRN
jgi:hypothetical protein